MGYQTADNLLEQSIFLGDFLSLLPIEESQQHPIRRKENIIYLNVCVVVVVVVVVVVGVNRL